MKRTHYRGLSWLALAMISGILWAKEPIRALPPEALASIKNSEQARVVTISAHVESLKATYGLGAQDGLREMRRSTDEFGKTHAHFKQVYQGTPVWGSLMLGHMDAEGSLEATKATVYSGIALEAANLLSAETVQSLSLKRLGISVTAMPVKVEKIVFPTQHQDGLKLVRKADGGWGFDERYSVATSQKAQPYVWAYHVTVSEGKFGEKGLTEMVVDASTGEVLKKWDGRNYDATAVGHSQYNGTVTVNTTPYAWENTSTGGTSVMPPSGTYNTLCDTTRATKLADYWVDSSYPELKEPGIKTFWLDNYFACDRMSGAGIYLNTGTEWGDGLTFTGNYDYDQAVNITLSDTSANGQTAAVDATYGVTSTWDFFKNVFGRNGIDGQGSAPTILVHVNEGWYQGMTPMVNAYWSETNHAMYFGDGDLSQGYGPFTSLDITAHELTHGVVAYSGNGLANSLESGGLNESTADVFSAMTRFYVWGGNGGSTIPDVAPNAPNSGDKNYLWSTGRQITIDHSAIRNMYKPSLDGVSYDAWFDGMGLDDVHFSMGPGNRLFYFLSQGASSSSGNVAYSALLPGGMTGLGNDKAGRIWYRALTTQVTDANLTYHGFRVAMLAAAAELFGSGSTEVAAVQNAFAAINVGAPAGGSEPVLVTMPRQIQGVPDDNNGNAWNSIISSFIVVPIPGVAQLLPTPTIANASNAAFTWSLGGLNSSVVPQGGKVIDGKSFLAPYINNQFWSLKVASDQDAARFAATVAYVTSMDVDNDTEFDAIDLATYALSWGRNVYTYTPAAVPLVDPTNNTVVDDVDILLAKQGFNNAFAN